MADKKHGVFISHIAPEKPVAFLLQDYIRKAFGADYPVFVASDQTSIGGGRKWFEYIISNLRKAKVVLVLVSQESHFKEWINFEGGLGDGAGACVVPVAIKTFTFDKLRFPLSGYNGRYIADIEGILHDISRETGSGAERIDAAKYRDEILKAEASLIYKSVITKPRFTSIGNEPYLAFSIQNNGNMDLDLLMFEAWVPHQLTILPNWHRPQILNLISYETVDIGGIQYWHSQYTTAYTENGAGIAGLRSVLTPSMGELELGQPLFKLRRDQLSSEEKALRILYHLHARNFTTVREEKPFQDCG